MKSKIKKFLNIILVSIFTLLSLFSLTACTESDNFCVSFVYKDIYDASLIDRVTSFTNYLYRFSQSMLEQCAKYFGPSNSDIINGVDYKALFGMNYEYNNSISKEIIANDLSMMKYAYYYSIGDTDDNKVLILTNSGNNMSGLLNIHENNGTWTYNLGASMYKLTGDTYSSISQGQSYQMNSVYRHVNGSIVTYIFIGKSIGSSSLNTISLANELIKRFYTYNNTGVIQNNFRDVNIIAENTITPFSFTSWNYAIPSDKYTNYYKNRANNPTNFFQDYTNVNDSNSFLWDKNSYKLAFELVLALRFGYEAEVPKESLPSSLSTNVGPSERNLKAFYDYAREQDNAITYRNFVLSACAPLDTATVPESKIEEFKKVLLKAVIGHDDIEGAYKRFYDYYADVIVNYAKNNVGYTATYDIKSGISQKISYDDLEESNAFLKSTQYTQAIVIYSYRAPEFLSSDPGNSQLNDIIVGITLPNGSSEEDYEYLSQYIVTYRTYSCKTEKNETKITTTCTEYSLQEDGDSHNFYVEITASGTLSNQGNFYPQDNEYIDVFTSATGTKRADYNKGEVRGYGSYYKGGRRDGEQFVEVIFTSPTSERMLNIVVSYIIL